MIKWHIICICLVNTHIHLYSILLKIDFTRQQNVKCEFQNNNFHKYTCLNIISSLFFCIITSSKKIKNVSSCLSNLTNVIYVSLKCLDFFSILKNKYPCHVKHACRGLSGLISYGFFHKIIIWCIKLNKNIEENIASHLFWSTNFFNHFFHVM